MNATSARFLPGGRSVPAYTFVWTNRAEPLSIDPIYGDGEGIALIADHPSLNRQPDQGDERYKTNQLRTSDEILKRFTDAYREEKD